MATSSAYMEIRLAKFAEAIDHGEGVEVFEEGTVLLDLHGDEETSTISLPPEAAMQLGKQLVMAAVVGIRVQKRARKERGNG